MDAPKYSMNVPLELRTDDWPNTQISSKTFNFKFIEKPHIFCLLAKGGCIIQNKNKCMVPSFKTNTPLNYKKRLQGEKFEYKADIECRISYIAILGTKRRSFRVFTGDPITENVSQYYASLTMSFGSVMP